MKKKENKAKKNAKHLMKTNIAITGTLNFKEYVGSIDYNNSENVFYGKVLYINDSILYSADNLEDLTKEFESSIEDYLEMCKNEDLEPNKPMGGVFNVRTTPQNHYFLSVISKRENTTLNKIINEAINLFINEKGLAHHPTLK